MAILTPMLKHTDPTPIPLGTFADLVLQEGWVVIGSNAAYSFVKGRSATSAVMCPDGALLLTLGSGDNGLSHELRIEPDYHIMYGAYPYLIQIWNKTLQECDRPRAEGGGRHEKLLPAVFLAFHNAKLRAKTDAKFPKPVRPILEFRPPSNIDDLLIESGPGVDELGKAALALVDPELKHLPRLTFITRDGEPREHALSGISRSSGYPGLRLELYGTEGADFNPVTGKGSFFED